MIDFFHKRASMTKRVSGIASIKGMPGMMPRPPRRITRVGTFYDGESPVVSLLLEVADTEEARRRGMMGRSEAPEIYGMLFEGLSGGGSFWMKNCLIPLDVAFMDESGAVTRTYSMPVGDDGEQQYEYGKNDVSALEVGMGLLKRFGVGKGCVLKTRKLAGEEEDDD